MGSPASSGVGSLLIQPVDTFQMLKG